MEYIGKAFEFCIGIFSLCLFYIPIVFVTTLGGPFLLHRKLIYIFILISLLVPFATVYLLGAGGYGGLLVAILLEYLLLGIIMIISCRWQEKQENYNWVLTVKKVLSAIYIIVFVIGFIGLNNLR